MAARSRAVRSWLRRRNKRPTPPRIATNPLEQLPQGCVDEVAAACYVRSRVISAEQDMTCGRRRKNVSSRAWCKQNRALLAPVPNHWDEVLQLTSLDPHGLVFAGDVEASVHVHRFPAGSERSGGSPREQECAGRRIVL